MSIITSVNINAIVAYLRKTNQTTTIKKTRKKYEESYFVGYLAYFVESGGVREWWLILLILV